MFLAPDRAFTTGKPRCRQARQGEPRPRPDREHGWRDAGARRVFGRPQPEYYSQREGARPGGRHSVPAGMGARGAAFAINIPRVVHGSTPNKCVGSSPAEADDSN